MEKVKKVLQSYLDEMGEYDKYTLEHCEAVGDYSYKIGKEMNLSENDLKQLCRASLLHDYGKLKVPLPILNKRDKLAENEYEIIKSHSTFGSLLVSQIDELKESSIYLRHHHEHWDGRGYPDGLKGDEIPLLCQIISVADAWHAMRSERPYKRSFSKEEALKEIVVNRGAQFSPRVVDVFVKIAITLD